MRIGHGLDIHAFGGKDPLVMGGVQIPFNKGIEAHSDGDVVLHALIDALLGAAAMGDIGTLFPDTNPILKGLNSKFLLCETWRRIQKKGYYLGNVDVTIITQEPKILPFIPQMRLNISKHLNCYTGNVNIKATTTEQLGFIGRKEGIACEAIVLLNYHNRSKKVVTNLQKKA